MATSSATIDVSTAYTHQALSAVECKKMNRAASQLIETAKRWAASAG